MYILLQKDSGILMTENKIAFANTNSANSKSNH